MEHARPPAELTVEGGPAARADAWRTWRRLFLVFLKASGVAKEPADVQASLLINLIGPAGYDVYTTFSYVKDEKEDDIECLLKKFDEHFGTKPNVTLARFKFFTRNQDTSETIDQYVTSLRLLSQHCEFMQLRDSLIRDRIVCGISNTTVRDRLLRTDDLTLAKAVQICEAAEMSKEEGRLIEGSTAESSVDAIWKESVRGGGSRGRGGGRRALRGRGARYGARPAGCGACGSPRCAGDVECPARSATCFVCGRVGHFHKSKKCSSRKVFDVNVDSSDEEVFYINIISEVAKNSSCKEWFETFVCNGKRIQFKLDTGSMLNVIAKSDFLKLGFSLKMLKPFIKRVQSFTGNDIPILGAGDLTLSHESKLYDLTFVVADFNCQNILGLKGCIALHLINRVNAVCVYDKYKSRYPELFNGLGKLPGRYTISINDNIEPVICPPRKIPLGLRDKLYSELCRLENMGVIRKVTHPTDWVNAIVVVAKKNGDIRLCLDPRPLNRAIRRAHYSLPTVTEVAVKLRDAKYFSVLDATSSFWMIELDDASADLCTFGTPSHGRYQFLRLPFGINCASEVFHAKIRQYLEDLDGTDSFIDDIIVWGRTREEHDMRLERLLQRSNEIGIKYNYNKCKFCVREIVFLGHKFNCNGMQPDDTKIKAIISMPDPSDRKALERFLGMVNYLSKFIPNYSESVAVLRGLLKKDTEWVWYPKHSEAIENLKKKLSSAPVLALYSLELPVVVSVDASAHAVGAVLLQAGRPVEFASLTLTDTQVRYAQIEKEMLAIVFAVERFRQYLFGRQGIVVQSDHKPLEALCNKPLASVPCRLQRMMMRIQGYDLKVVYTPGKFMYIADTLSRAALPELLTDRLSTDVESQTCFLIENAHFSNEKLELIKKHIVSDAESTSLISYIINGWPKHKKNINDNLQLFWQHRNLLQYADGLIFKDDVLYIPKSLRKLMLDRVHEGHLGIDRCKRRARDVMFWPGMSRDVERVVRGCAACAQHAPRPRPAPLRPHYVPDIPCSREFKNFMCEWEVRHMTSSPHYPQSNGKSERTVQTVKQLLKKCIDSGQDFYISLLNYRTTPRDGIDSPAQILMGRRLNTKLPINQKLLRENVDNVANHKSVLSRQEEMKRRFDKRANPLRDLAVGEKVTLADGTGRKPVSVVARAPEPRSYLVRDNRGKVCRRTRRHLIARTAPASNDNVTSQASSTYGDAVTDDDDDNNDIEFHSPQKITSDSPIPGKDVDQTTKRKAKMVAKEKIKNLN
ncbi:uncharacterized protein LOC128199832 [Bicyclus anynana]|uniref:RNA-directed DNA polymerase n=1 Tax=Bicyclus anynana TaxID=110368 RepID=A0ABM3M7D1_BICAN|nr:uncharacterized protein LOC128199832 [Bicyclus anynana]